MNKIYIPKLEARLSTRVTPNLLCFGVDVSLHSTGLALLKTTDSYLQILYLNKIIVPKEADVCDAFRLFISQADDIRREISQEHYINKTLIEDCFYGSNVKTLKTLARSGIIIFDRFKDISAKVEFITPTKARNMVGFKKSHKDVKGVKFKKEIINYINVMLNGDITDTDLADACVLALAGVVE